MQKFLFAQLHGFFILFYLFLAGLNLYVALNFDESVWVTFKVAGLMPISMVFMMSQMYFVFKRSKEIEEPTESKEQ